MMYVASSAWMTDLHYLVIVVYFTEDQILYNELTKLKKKKIVTNAWTQVVNTFGVRLSLQL